MTSPQVKSKHIAGVFPGSNMDKHDPGKTGNYIVEKSKKPSGKALHYVQRYLRQPDEIFLDYTSGLSHRLKSSHIMCIEFGPTEVRLMHLSRAVKKYQIERWKEISIQKTDLDDPAMILETIGRFIDSCKVKRPKVVLVLHGPEVIVKAVKLPLMNGEQLREAVYWKIKQEIPSFSDNDLWDFHPISEIVEGEKKWLRVLTIIAQEKFVKRYLDILNQIRINPAKVIVKPIALTLALRSLTYERVFTTKNIALIEMGRDSTLLCFFRHGVPEFVRILPMGSDNIDKALLKPLVLKNRKIKLKPEKVELFKRKYGIVDGILKQPEKVVFPFTKLYHHMLPVLQRFVSELNRSIAFYENNFSGAKVQVTFFTGKGANLKNLNSFLIHQLGFPVFSVGPFFPSIRAGEHFQGNEYTACFGAACHKGKKFNLVPKDLRTAKRYKYWQKVIIGASFLIFSAFALFSINLSDTLDSYRAENAIRKTEYQKMIPTEKKYKQLTQQFKEMSQFKLGPLSRLKSTTKIVDNLRILSTLIPDDIVLSSIDYKDIGSTNIYDMKNENEGIMVLNGMVYKNFMSADITLIQFITGLQDLNYYKNIELADKSKDNNNKTFSFKINMHLP